MPDPAITTVHFAPGGHLLRVEAGPVPVDAQSRTAKDVFAPGPGWTLMAGEGAGSSFWEGITRTAERATVIATVRLEPDGRRTATLAPVAEEALADRRLQAVERWLRSLGEEVRAQTAVLLAAARAALDDDRNTTAAEDAAALVQMNEAAQRISQHMDAPS
ncbi:MAG: hypothetical protein VX000_14830, partial [Myxococcota bacterium]|nr:hypothetical protein [Myxococcota bacterium]